MKTPVVMDPLEEIFTAPFALTVPSCPPPCNVRVHKVHDLLCSDESTVCVAVLPTRFVIVPTFKAMEKNGERHLFF